MSQRLLVYDATHAPGERLLRAAWATGARVYRSARAINAHHGATSWLDALTWLATRAEQGRIAEIQYWGHGKWGALFIGRDCFDVHALAPSSEAAPMLAKIRAALNAESLVWLRTCETFGADAGHQFAMRLSECLGARVAGHTHVIGALQSGLYGLLPGMKPHWPADAGLAAGSPSAPAKARASTPNEPHTVHFLSSAIPEAWFRAPR